MKQKKADQWVVREWYNYGQWDRYVSKTLYFEANSRKEALEKYHAEFKPKFPQHATIKANPY